jgi:uncharacterized membrane protein YhaH (DUF805 family)
VNNYFGAMLRYFEFNGRSSRREYYWYTLGWIVAVFGGFWIDYNLLGYWHPGKVWGPVLLFVTFIHVVPNVTLLVRRLHDAGKSGWWYWICLVPFIGGLWLLYLTMIKGPDENSDRFGPDPRDPDAFDPPPLRLERHQPLTRAQLLVQQMEERRRRMA